MVYYLLEQISLSVFPCQDILVFSFDFISYSPDFIKPCIEVKDYFNANWQLCGNTTPEITEAFMLVFLSEKK